MSYRLIRARKCLLRVIRPLAYEQAKYLHRRKEEGKKQAQRRDLIWFLLLQSMATMGNVRGYLGLICTRENFEKVTFDALSKKRSSKDRIRVLNETLRAAKVRRPDQKAKWLASNFDKILEMGGLSASKKNLLKAQGKQGKIDFLKAFSGIGDKYARNMMMDIYHAEFHDSIAVDERIKRLSQELDLSFPDYSSQEDFYLGVAHEIGLQGWELDRLVFTFIDDIICLLKFKT
jgi:hypothetical protein